MAGFADFFVDNLVFMLCSLRVSFSRGALGKGEFHHWKYASKDWFSCRLQTGQFFFQGTLLGNAEFLRIELAPFGVPLGFEILHFHAGFGTL